MSDYRDLVKKLNSFNEEKRVVASMCKMHFEKQPMKISKAQKQYLYDDKGYDFLDCSGNLAHVGHCHPHVVHNGQKQMGTLAVAQGFLTEVQTNYAKALLGTVGEGKFDTVLFVNSGSEAVDLALRLAKEYTRRTSVVVPQPALHGHSSTLCNMHYKFTRRKSFVKESWVHHIPLCNKFRGHYASSANPLQEAIEDFKILVDDLRKKNQPIAAFLTEAIHSSAGNVVPPKGYLQATAQIVRDAGGLVILDEVLTGLGRLGTHWWAYQHFGIVPDILVCGRSLGNGQPIAVVITSQDIACSLMTYSNSYGGNPVSCAMGLAVIEVIKNEHLLESCANVGKALLSGFTDLQAKYVHIGDVRGMGLSVVIEIVKDKISKKPAPDIAERITYQLRDKHRVIAPVDGPDGNCLFITPPMCFSLENAKNLVKFVDSVMTDIELNKVEPVRTLQELIDHYQIPTDFVESSKRKADDREESDYPKKSKYDDID